MIVTREVNNWNDGAYAVTEKLARMAEVSYFEGLENSEACKNKILSDFENMVYALFQSQKTPNNNLIESDFIGIAVCALTGYAYESKVSIQEAGKHVAQTIIGKQRMYGHGNIARFAVPGIAIRLNDKLERLKNLQKHNGPVLFEPLQDTWLDICGYSVIGIMWLNDWFLLELVDASIQTSGT